MTIPTLIIEHGYRRGEPLRRPCREGEELKFTGVRLCGYERAKEAKKKRGYWSLDRPKRIVMAAIDAYSAERYTYITVAEIVKRTGRSEQRLKGHLKRLTEAGYLERNQLSIGHGRRGEFRYRLSKKGREYPRFNPQQNAILWIVDPGKNYDIDALAKATGRRPNNVLATMNTLIKHDVIACRERDRASRVLNTYEKFIYWAKT